jgi:nitrogen fixation NifU-like protein
MTSMASQPSPAAPDPATPAGNDLFDDHFHRPRNAGMLERPDGRVEVENPVCGDVLCLTWSLGAEGVIDAVRFQVYGCPAAIAAGSYLTELVSGATLARLAEVDAESIGCGLGGLTEQRYHAAVLAADGLAAMLGEIQRCRKV